jgi:hypothetical protein
MGFQTITINHTKVIRLKSSIKETHGPELPYMVVSNLCTLSNVHNTNTNSISLQFWQCEYMAP